MRNTRRCSADVVALGPVRLRPTIEHESALEAAFEVGRWATLRQDATVRGGSCGKAGARERAKGGIFEEARALGRASSKSPGESLKGRTERTRLSRRRAVECGLLKNNVRTPMIDLERIDDNE